MKATYYTFLMICFSLVCKAQSNWEKVSDSLAMISRVNADAILAHFDTLQTSKLLYSLDDRYYYLIIKDIPCYKEFYVATDSLGRIKEIHLVKNDKKGRKHRKQEEQYRKLLSEANPFDLSQYHTGYITKMPEATYVSGRLSYFVIKDIDGKRYGEYNLSTITIPSPIHKSLWVYLIKRISEESAKNIKNTSDRRRL